MTVLFNQQRIDAATRIKARAAHQPTVDNHRDAINRQRGLRDVGRDDDLALRSRPYGAILFGCRKRAIQRSHKTVSRNRQATYRFNRPADLIASGHKDQNIPLGGVLQKARQFPRYQIPGRQLLNLSVGFEIAGFHRKGASLGANDRGIAEVVYQCLRLKRCRHHNHLQVGPWTGLQLFCEPQHDVGIEVALVKLIKHNGGHVPQLRIALQLAQNDAIGLKLDPRSSVGGVVEANLIADLLPKRNTTFFGNSARQHAGGDSTRL